MKKRTFTLLLALALGVAGVLCAMMAPRTLAAPDVTLIEYASNPVYDPPSSSDKAYYPCVIYDANQFSGNGASYYYKMWYADGSGQYEAVTYSNDGINWSTPEQTTGIAETGYHAQVLYDPDGFGAGPYCYRIWYWLGVQNYVITDLHTAESVDGVNFVNDQALDQDAGAKLVTGPGGSDWNRGSYGPTTVFYNPSATNSGSPFNYSYTMYFDATTGGYEVMGLGYSMDGKYWYRYGSDPVLDRGPGAWDSDYSTFGSVVRGGDGTWRMWYSGSGPGGGANQGIGFASSSDGLTWTKDDDNPVFSIYQGVDWRNARCYTPSVVYSSSRFDGNGTACYYKMWFTGEASATGNRTIGYAYSSEPILELQKTADPSGTVKRGDTITYTLTADNDGSGPATGCVMTDAIPGYTDYVTGSTTLNGSPIGDVGGTSPLVGGMSVNSLGQAAGTIAADDGAVVTFQVTVQNALPIGSSVPNSVTLDADGQSTLSANCSNPSGSPVITLQKTADPSGRIKRGQLITYTLTAGNTGTDASYNSTITDAIPGYTDYVPGSTTLNGSAVADVGGTSPLVTGMLVNSTSQPAGKIADGAQARVTFKVLVKSTLPLGSSVSNSATLSANLLPPANASCSNSSGSPVIALRKSANPSGRIKRGQLLTYTLAAINNGTDAAFGSVITDEIPGFTSYVPGSTTLNGNGVPDVGGTTPLAGGMRVNSSGKSAGTIADGSQAVVTFKVRAVNDLPSNQVITNEATLSSKGLSPATASCANRGAVAKTNVWYLAEGSTAWGFDCYVTIENPNKKSVHTRVTYMTPHGPVAGGTFLLSPESQGNVSPRDTLGEDDFSTKVECLEGDAIAVDRTMTWTGRGAESPEAHSSVGVTTPSKVWYLPEGSSNWGFESWLLIQNPNSTETICTVTYMIEGSGPVVLKKTLPANSRETYSMESDIGSHDASVQVEADSPVIAERAMYLNNRRGGHDSIGTIAAASDYFLAEGTTAWGFTTYVLVQNPEDSETTVTITYMTGDGPVRQNPFTMPANSRKTIRVNDSLRNRDFSTRVHGDKPVIAERAMYWDNGTGVAMHDSIGLASAHLAFLLPDGESSNGRETWTLVQNPNATPVTVEISYFTPTGSGNKTFTDIVPANSRESYNMADLLSDSRAAIRVISKSAGKPIMCERAMYWNSRGVGTDTIGAGSD